MLYLQKHRNIQFFVLPSSCGLESVGMLSICLLSLTPFPVIGKRTCQSSVRSDHDRAFYFFIWMFIGIFAVVSSIVVVLFVELGILVVGCLDGGVECRDGVDKGDLRRALRHGLRKLSRWVLGLTAGFQRVSNFWICSVDDLVDE